MKIEVGSYEAKTKLPELLRGVQSGNCYTITLRGEPVADLVPAESSKDMDSIAAVDQMHQFMLSATPICGVDVKAMVEDGRA